MAAIPPGVIDPTKNAKYPVILSDALRGRGATEVFTGIRYNHKPPLSSENAPDTASLRLSSSLSSSETYDLAFEDGKEKYAYNGTRATDTKQYVLCFDEARKAFILDRVDSVFSMNVTRTPEDADAESLRRKFRQLDASVPAVPDESTTTTTTTTRQISKKESAPAATAAARDTKGKAPAVKATTAAARKKAEKEKSTPAKVTKKDKAKESAKQTTRKQPEKKTKNAVELLLPDPSPALPATKPSSSKSSSSKSASTSTALPTAAEANTAASSQQTATSNSRKKHSDSDSDSDSDDGGLLVEYPDMDQSRPVFNSNANNGFSPAFPTRRWSEFVNQGEEPDDADAEGEPDDDLEEELNKAAREDDDVRELQLPSPVGVAARVNAGGHHGHGQGQGLDAADIGDGGGLEDDLEAELEAELAEEESEVSEED